MENILVAVAWPYANGSLHLGHVAGCYLPADIFARYHRLKGNNVLMVSGSDQHGAPITIRAEKEKKTAQEIVDTYHTEFLDCWQRLGISFDLFTRTGTANHAQVVHDIFLKLLEKGYLYKQETQQAYCPECKRFMPDRYVEGTCPYCKFPEARGDQCDQCGQPLNPGDLLNFRCKICGNKPEFKPSEHFFLKLSAFEQQLKDWVSPQTHWRQNVRRFTLGLLEEGLKDRAITRDLDWGVTVPYEGFENKRIYVWFEAVIGYLSASKEWASSQRKAEKWKDWWTGDAKSYYFIGKDNIPFHTVIWPAMLMGYGGLMLPANVPANEFLTIEGKKLSTSRNWAVWLPDYLANYDPDPLRFVLSINMPETGDTDFSWHEFLRRNNDELVATYGNLVHRVLTFTQKNFDGIVPDPGAPDDQSQALFKRCEDVLVEVGGLLEQCRFKEGLKLAMQLAQEANRYIDEKAPWKAIKQDKAAAGRAVYTTLCLVSALKTITYPYLPFSSKKLHGFLGFDTEIENSGWKIVMPSPGTRLPVPQALFNKLDDSIVAREMERMGTPQ
jgi:methionyl-tRNA synthetase